MLRKAIILSVLSAISFADLTTGRHDAFDFHYGKTTDGDVAVFGHDWFWDLPFYPTQHSSTFFLAGISRWMDDSAEDNSFFGFHVGSGMKFLLDSPSPNFFPYVAASVGIAYFGEKNFGDAYSIDNQFMPEINLQAGINFGSQSEFELGIGLAHYFSNGGDDINVGPQIYLGYHF